MDRNNEYYDLISGLVKSHRKYAGYEAILEDIIDDVFAHSESVIKTIKDEKVIRSYLEKVVSTSIITVPKKINFHNELKHRTISTAPSPAVNSFNEPAPATAEVIQEPAPAYKPEPDTTPQYFSLISEEPETVEQVIDEELVIEEEPVQKANVEFVDKMINSMDVESVLSEPEKDEISDSDFDEILEINEEENEVEIQNELIDELSVDEEPQFEDSVISQEENKELELTEPDDFSDDEAEVSGFSTDEEIDEETDEEIVEQYDLTEDMDEDSSDLAMDTEVITDSGDDLQTAEVLELQPDELADVEEPASDDTNINDSMEVVELSLSDNDESEYSEEADEESLTVESDEADETEILSIQEDEPAEEQEVITNELSEEDDVNELVSFEENEEPSVGFDDETQSFDVIKEEETENGILDAEDELQIADTVEEDESAALDAEEPQTFEMITDEDSENSDISLEEETQNFDVIDEPEPVAAFDELSETPEMISEEDTDSSLEEEPQIAEVLSDEENVSNDAFDDTIGLSEFSTESENELLPDNDYMGDDSVLSIDVDENNDDILGIDNQEHEELHFAGDDLIMPDNDGIELSAVDSDILTGSKPDTADKVSELKAVDYSAFYFEPKNEELSFDEQDILHGLYKLSQMKPDSNVLKIFDLKFKQNLSVNQIAEQLNTDKEEIVSVLDEIVNIVS